MGVAERPDEIFRKALMENERSCAIRTFDAPIRILTKNRSPEASLCILVENGVPCTNAVASRGICGKHEAYLRKQGRYEEFALPRRTRKLIVSVKPLPEPGIYRLIVNGQPCTAVANRRGLCNRHYQSLWQRPDLDVNAFCLRARGTHVFRLRKHSVDGICRIHEDGKDCDVKVHARGLCERHYTRLTENYPALFEHLATPDPKERRYALRRKLKDSQCRVEEDGHACHECAAIRGICRHHYSPSGASDDTKDYKTIAYYDGNGLVTKTADPFGNSSTAYYDTYNRLQWSRDPLGNKVEYAYDSNNNVLTTISYEIVQVNGATKTFTVAALYDGRNRATKMIDQGKDGDITQTADNGVAVLAYDALGRRTNLTDADGVISSWAYDSLGRLTRTTEDVGTGHFNRNTDRAYDRAGRMTQITDNLSDSTAYAYDKVSRLTCTSYADGGSDVVSQAYDKTGTVTKRIDQRGIATLYLYDSLHRLTKKQDDPTSPTIVETYARDALGRVTLAQLARSGTTQSDVRYYYDGLSGATRESQAIKGGTARNVDAVYDKGSNRITLNYPGGKSVAYTYDSDNRVSMILDGANARAQYLYVGPSRRSQVTLLNGASTVSTYKLQYDGVANITSALYYDPTGASTLIGFQHAYDKTHNPQYEIRVHESNYGDAYYYDNLYRVTRTIYDDANPASPTYAASRTDDFFVDLIGNRTKVYAKSSTATTYLHNPVNEYTSVAGTGYLYDAAGNLTQDAAYTYFWDYENRLTRVQNVSNGSNVADYTYDATMRRVEKIDYTHTPNVTTRFYQDKWSDIEEHDGSDTLTATYVNGPRIDEYVTMTRNGTEYWYMQSPIVRNVVVLVNSSGAIQEGYTYTAYGTDMVHTGAGADGIWFTTDDVTATSSAIDNPSTFTGRRYDPETQLLYFRMRMYSSSGGDFISRDPTGFRDDMSLYLFGRERPLSATDPWGLDSGCESSATKDFGRFALDQAKTMVEKLESLAKALRANPKCVKAIQDANKVLKVVKALSDAQQILEAINEFENAGNKIIHLAQVMIAEDNMDMKGEDCKDLCHAYFAGPAAAPIFDDGLTITSAIVCDVEICTRRLTCPSW